MNQEIENQDDTKKRPKLVMGLSFKIIALIFTIISLPPFWEVVSKLLTSEETKQLQKFKSDTKAVRFKDSIINIERVNFTRQSFIDQKKIAHELSKLFKELKDVNHVTIWKAHDGGDPVSTSSFKYLTAMYSVSRDNIDILADFRRRDISSGYNWLIGSTVENKYVYINDVLTSKSYIGEAADYASATGTKSIITLYIKSLSSIYYMSIAFTVTNPLLENPFMYIKSKNTKERVKNLIYETPSHLRNNANYEE